MKTSLERIANKAKTDKRHRFKNLYREINRWTLWNSWKQLNKKSATGIDGVSCKEYEDNLQENLIKLESRLKNKKYRAPLVRRKLIPKANGKMRPLGIPTTEDKLLQHTTARILNAIYEQDFLPNMYGYRTSKNPHKVIKDIKVALESGNYHYVVEADVKGYFDNLDHSWIVRMLEQRVDDNAFIRLIKKWLKAGIVEEKGKVICPLKGSPQGGVISPLLANIYMHYCLGLWFEKVIKTKCRGKAEIFIYADDFICLFQWRDDAERFYATLGKRFEKFGLELSEEKTNIVDFRYSARQTFEFLGFEYRWAKTGNYQVRIRTARSRLRRSIQLFKDWLKEQRSRKLRVIMGSLNSKLRGYYNYFGIWGNMKSTYTFYDKVRYMLFKWLNRRSQRRSYSWKSFNEMLNLYKLEKPSLG